VVFGFKNNQLEILLVKRKRRPAKGAWALPGGFILDSESLDESAIRILEETSNVKDIYMEQVQAFGEINRFPLQRVITIAYFALINPERHFLKPGIDTTAVKWIPVNDRSPLPFDHEEILFLTLKRLRQKIRYKPIGFELLPDKFTLTQLQILYESILDIRLDKRNFRRKILSFNMLEPLDEFQKGVSHRAARLFKFNILAYNKLEKSDFNFEL
jgi:8-oxo-dGTP diphosphatase